MFFNLTKVFKQYKLPLFFWAIAYLCFATFIFVFSYLYPYGADEMFYQFNCTDFISAVKCYLGSYAHNNPRIGLILNTVILSNGKWLFLVLNPVIQSILITLVIILVKGKKIDFYSLKDMPLFILTAIMAVLFIPSPDNTLFWIGGAANYSWSIIPFLLFLIFIRFIYERQNIPTVKNTHLFFLFFLCIIANMCNENTSLANLIISALFIIYSVKKHFKNRYVLYVIFSGLIAGTLLLFLAPGSYQRLSHPVLTDLANAPIFSKIIYHLHKINDLFISMYCIPLLIFIFLCLEMYSVKLKVLKNNDFLFSIVSFITASFLAAVLAGAPILDNARVFYSSAIMYIISFLFIVKYFSEYYRLRLMTYFAMAAFIFFVIILPLFSMPYINLYKQDKTRNEYIAKAKTQNKTAYLWFLYQITVPIENYNHNYYDILLDKRTGKFLNMKIDIIDKHDNQIGSFNVL